MSSSAWSLRPLGARLVARAIACLLIAAATASVAAPTPRPGASPAPVPSGGASLPSLSTKESTIEVYGKILRSSRGHPGPVRLEVEKREGGRIDVLVAPDDLCQQLGLSLRAGEEIHLKGSLFNGRTPIVIASAVFVDDKEVPVRLRPSTPKASGQHTGAPAPAKP